jgi:hypothetical protein
VPSSWRAGVRGPFYAFAWSADAAGELDWSSMTENGIVEFEHFFRAAAGLDVDKSDVARVHGFVNHEVADLLVRAEAFATANGRDVVARADLPITKGLQERSHEFEKLDADIGLEPHLRRTVRWPQLDLDLGDEARAELPRVAGGLCLALARSFGIIDPGLRNPATSHWQRAFRLFDLVL